MSELSPEARAIVDAGRDGDAAGDLERARVRRALFATIAAGGGAAVAGSTAAAAQTVTATAPTAAATATLPLAKILVPLAILAAGSVGGTIAWHARGVELTTPPSTAHVEHVAARAPLAPPEPVTAPVAVPRAVAHRAVLHAAAPPHEAPFTTNRLAEETALLSSANAALRTGEASRALALLDDYDRRYPAGVLREEMLATRIIARCRLGIDGAASGVDAFLARHPRSPLATRVRSSCGR